VVGSGSAETRGLLSDDRFDVRGTEPPVDAAEVAGDPDCIVFGPGAPLSEGIELLAAVRDRGSTLPFVLVAATASDDAVESVAGRHLAALLPADVVGVPGVLRGCVTRLVGQARLEALARRALAAVRASGEGVAFADPDGTLAFVTRAYARRFGYEPEGLRGRPWTACFPSAEASRLRSNALTTVREGWQWVGGCVGQRADGTCTDTVRLRITGLEDDSLVFRVASPGPAG
jgi:PAS domain S-box-containing protein